LPEVVGCRALNGAFDVFVEERQTRLRGVQQRHARPWIALVLVLQCQRV